MNNLDKILAQKGLSDRIVVTFIKIPFDSISKWFKKITGREDENDKQDPPLGYC